MRRGVVVAVFAGLLVLSSAASAQFDTAEVLGTVRDASGGVLAKATVTLINPSTGIATKTTSDAAGNYDFFNVKAGQYTITAELESFTKFSTENVVVNVDARQRADITMQLG